MQFLELKESGEYWRDELDNLSISFDRESKSKLSSFSRSEPTKRVAFTDPSVGTNQSNSKLSTTKEDIREQRNLRRLARRNKWENSKKKGSSKRASSDVSLSSATSQDLDSESDFDDHEYRNILKVLVKSAKDYKIQELTMNPDPIQRRERFGNWVIDLRNILSTHHQTSGLFDDYPAYLEEFEGHVDRAIKALLSSITKGMTKRIVDNEKTAFKALLYLKRNYG